MTVVEWFNTLSWMMVLDFGIVFLLIFSILFLIRSSRSLDLIYSIIVIFAVYALSYFFELKTLKWLIEKFAIAYIIILAIIFQTELKRAVDKVRFGGAMAKGTSESLKKSPILIKHLLTAVDTLCKQKMGAIIVLELEFNLDDYIESGIPINGQISSELLINLFWKGSPTHDGAVIIRESQIIAAGCFLPLTDSKKLDSRLGTRHMAAIGLSEQTDALVIVVSEETGTISIVESGNMTRYLNREALETRLFRLYQDADRDEVSSS